MSRLHNQNIDLSSACAPPTPIMNKPADSCLPLHNESFLTSNTHTPDPKYLPSLQTQPSLVPPDFPNEHCYKLPMRRGSFAFLKVLFHSFEMIEFVLTTQISVHFRSLRKSPNYFAAIEWKKAQVVIKEVKLPKKAYSYISRLCLTFCYKHLL